MRSYVYFSENETKMKTSAKYYVSPSGRVAILKSIVIVTHNSMLLECSQNGGLFA